MFAPHCPSCLTRRLLGPGGIVASAWEQGGSVHLRCHCGTIIAITPERRRPTAA